MVEHKSETTNLETQSFSKPDSRLRLKTESIWGHPDRNYFRFLDRIQKLRLPKTLCILGCSDGKFVIPAAKRGFSVLAIDMDRVALFGGVVNLSDRQIKIGGLTDRLRKEGLEEKVKVVHDDYIAYSPESPYSGVFTSGSIHYGENSKYTFRETMESVKKYVAIPGLLFFEYIHRSEFDSDPKRHFTTSQELETVFDKREWEITSHKKRTYVEEPNPRVNQIHTIVWGRLYALRKTSTSVKTNNIIDICL